MKRINNSFLPKAEITVPNVTRDLLMFAPSFNLLPVAPVEFALSLQDKAKMLAQGTCTHYCTSILVPCKTSLTKLFIVIIAETGLQQT